MCIRDSYWGWDAVENASLLSWLVGVALIHSFTVYRQRGAFKRWSVMCACLTFAFVIVGTFISRSGIVQSVHAFEGDPVSLVPVSYTHLDVYKRQGHGDPRR